jgi:hypothetical protein
MTWYHGTNQIIDQFKIDENLQGLNTASATTQGMVYFTDSQEVAADYAQAAANKMYPENHLKHEKRLQDLVSLYEQQLNKCLFDQSEKTYEQIEAVEENLKADRSGQCIYPAELFPKKVMVHDFEMKEWGNAGTDDILQKAKDDKVDALFIKNVKDQPSMEAPKIAMTLAVVFNCRCIKFSFLSPKKGISPDAINQEPDAPEVSASHGL